MTAAPIAVDTLLDAASQATGLDDFGALAYREGLDRLAASLNEEAKLSDQGVAMAQGMLTSILANRLRVEAWWSTHPELADEGISCPVVIVGMSRSGTTALSQLLAKDPGGCVDGSRAAQLRTQRGLGEVTLSAHGFRPVTVVLLS
jgi:hypothetical protein